MIIPLSSCSPPRNRTILIGFTMGLALILVFSVASFSGAGLLYSPALNVLFQFFIPQDEELRKPPSNTGIPHFSLDDNDTPFDFSVHDRLEPRFIHNRFVPPWNNRFLSFVKPFLYTPSYFWRRIPPYLVFFLTRIADNRDLPFSSYSFSRFSYFVMEIQQRPPHFPS